MGTENIYTNLEAEGSKEQIQNWINRLKYPNLTEADYKQIRYEFIKSIENCNKTAYLDTKDKMTVGIGFNMDDASARIAWNTVFGGNGLDFDLVYNQNISLNDSEIKQLFDYSVKTRENEMFSSSQYGDIKNDISYNQRLTIESMWYNKPSLVWGPNKKDTDGTSFYKNLHDYIETSEHYYLDNALYEILNKSNLDSDNGIAHRRLKEASIFLGDSDLELAPETIAKIIEAAASENTKVVIDHNENWAIQLNEDKQLTIDIKEGAITPHEAIEYVNNLAPDLDIAVIDSRSIASDSGLSYTVKPGDTLSAIAESNYISLSELLSSNPQITDPNSINIL
jgi:GH24 family phage-related lysozyme (muramidase)